ncbi:MAG: hypothetical protein WCA36_04840 [Pseudolabrys sp.]
MTMIKRILTVGGFILLSRVAAFIRYFILAAIGWLLWSRSPGERFTRPNPTSYYFCCESVVG